MTGYQIKANKLRERREALATAETVDSLPTLQPRDEVVANGVPIFRSPEHAVDHIRTLWTEAQGKFLAIGRALREAKLRYPRAFERTIIPALPFGKQVAYQLRIIADAIDRGRLEPATMPQTYGAAYQLAILDEGQFQRAIAQNLVRSDVQRRDLEAFKRELALEELEAQGRHSVLYHEREKLKSEAEKLAARLAEIQAKLLEISAELGEAEQGQVIDGEVA